jgi:hypothetical protein
VTHKRLEELEARVRDLEMRLAAIARACGATPDEEPFGTGRGAPRPIEFRNRERAWKRAAKGIPGAYRVGRVWFVPRAAYAAWCAGRASTSLPASPQPRAANDVGGRWSPSAALRSVGRVPAREGDR